MLIKLSDIQTQTGFTDPKHARNLADWLRSERQSEPEYLDGEIAYVRGFVVSVLTNRLSRIENKYPSTLESVQNFISDTIHTPIQENPHNTPIFDTELGKDTEGALVPETGPFHQAEHTNGTDTRLPLDTDPETDIGSGHGSDAPTKEKPDRFRQFLVSPKAMLWGTIMAIGIFLPFTALNLQQNIAMERGIFVDGLCWFMAAIWDFSILLFALNGRKLMSGIGAFVMFVFVAAKFDFFARMMGDEWQLNIVIFCIVSYTPLLVHQFTELAVGTNKN